MSAVVSAVYPDRVEILTDGACYDEDGVLRSKRTKVMPAPDGRPIVIFGRGDANAIENLAQFLFSLTAGADLMETVAIAGLVLDRLRAANRSLRPDQHVEVYIAGCSRFFPPAHVGFLSATVPGLCNAFEFVSLDRLVCAPVASAEECKSAGLPFGFFGPDRSLADYGVEHMHLIRREASINPLMPERPPVHGIGCHVDHTVITMEEVTMTRLHTWPQDRVGERIDPLKVAA